MISKFFTGNSSSRKKIIKSVNLYMRFGSALWRLPTKILTLIFYCCFYHSFPSRFRAPILLTRICRLWREVAIGEPNLWCRLIVQSGMYGNWDANWERRAFSWDA
ncbi:uncharacterized protein EDB91DRAFT_334282 [Suillus paluster]|uniref:uncharacterized protein n=1 Tax=Suillus paluster TaxID=48578 RepID=UPI001B87884A|nr:uncharacterized protein EDB91DRAFT_334282 [Suillus paluster]KAG1741547.1 hypothetical protein EDB91DRAFT_334282 [Suillus paluster]